MLTPKNIHVSCEAAATLDTERPFGSNSTLAERCAR
jgi:hypothetical protein